jgi:hypothetical protein
LRQKILDLTGVRLKRTEVSSLVRRMGGIVRRDKNGHTYILLAPRKRKRQTDRFNLKKI